MTTYNYRTDSELPAVPIYWQQADGDYYDFASGWTFTVLVVDGATGEVKLTKTSGITGATGDVDTPNIVIAWAAGEMATIGVGIHEVLVNARRTADSFDLPLPRRKIMLNVTAVPTA